MNSFTLVIRPTAPFQTPLHSDTIFGHICWALRYLKGEDELQKFIGRFEKDCAPLIISSGFPDGYLPMPILRPMTIDEEDAILNKHFGGAKLECYRKMKELRKLSFISKSVFLNLKDRVTYYDIFDSHLAAPSLLDVDLGGRRKTVSIWRSSINRLTNTVASGKLFPSLKTFYESGSAFTIYLKDDFFGKALLDEVFEFVSRSGYGADKSVGCGAFEFELSNGWDLSNAENPNTFITLSNYHPQKGEFARGHYDTVTKFGKLGGHWATGLPGGPHKMPVIMFSPGSSFSVDRAKDFYGRVVAGVHKANEEIVQYGLALPLMVRAL